MTEKSAIGACVLMFSAPLFLLSGV